MTERQYLLTVLAAQLIRILILIPFLRNLRGLLRNVGEKNRAMRPALVWLNLIPVLDFAWILVTLIKVRDSLRAESATDGLTAAGESAFKVGLYSWICYVSVLVLQLVVLVSAFDNAALVYVVDFLGLGYLGFWIAYWAKTSAIKNRLAYTAAAAGHAPTASHPAQWGPSQSGQYPAGPQSGHRSCSSCGSAVGFDDAFCRSCGAIADKFVVSPVSDTAAADTCPFCGADYRPNAQFCSVCGRPVV